MSEALDAALAEASDAGLNVQAVLSAARIPALGASGSLVLLASTGRRLWSHVDLSLEHPIDAWSLEVLLRLQGRLPWASRLLFPSPPDAPHVDVLAAGRAAGWAHPSPLGIGVHPEHGLWMGYRGLLEVEADLPERGVLSAPSPCAGCPRPCVDACVGGAFQADSDAPLGVSLDLPTCFGSRLSNGRCATSCASRLACPIGSASAYDPAQLAHHQEAGNRFWRRYVREDATPE